MDDSGDLNTLSGSAKKDGVFADRALDTPARRSRAAAAQGLDSQPTFRTRRGFA